MLKILLILFCLLLPISFGSPVTPKYGWQHDHVPLLRVLVDPFVNEVLGLFNTNETEKILLNLVVKDEPFKIEHRVDSHNWKEDLEVTIKTNDPKLIEACQKLRDIDDMHVPVYNHGPFLVNVNILCDLKVEPKPEPTPAPEKDEDFNFGLHMFELVCIELIILFIIIFVNYHKARIVRATTTAHDYLYDRYSLTSRRPPPSPQAPQITSI